MDKQRFRHLNITLNQNFSERHDIPQMHFTMTDLKWLMEQAQKVEELEKYKGALSQIAHGDTHTAYPHDIAAWALGLKIGGDVE